ncbi:MAG: hypothetical protein AAFV71_23860 [Cyanobacteria bacterium J06633_8]
MKKELTLALAGTAIAVVANIAPAVGYQSHEHVFHTDDDIKKMNQIQGNGFCRVMFQHLKSSGDISGFDPNRVNHVWAHIKNGHCVANT